MKIIKLLLILTFVFLNLSSSAQNKIDSTLISLDRIYKSNDFQQERFGLYKWYENGDYYTKLEKSTTEKGQDIVKYSCENNKKEILIDANDLIPEGSKSPLKTENYFWSYDLSKLLIFTNGRKVWRSNTRGDYWIFDLNSKKLFQLGKNLPESSLMFAKFSYDDKKIAFVSKNNLYVQNLKNKKIEQLTFDGTDDIINGTFDWAYEEELKCRDGFRWSHDDKNIAFWQVDASNIDDFLMINNTDSIYSYAIPIQYPKAGENPSAAKIGTVNLKSKKINWVPIPGDPHQHYLPRLQWLENENKILIQQLNRKQNTNKLWLYKLNSGKATNFYTDIDKAWIDIDWSDVSQTKWEPSKIIFYNKSNNFLWISEKDGWRHIYSVEVATGKERLITKGDYDIASVYGFDEKNKVIYFNASPNNSTERYLYQINLDGSKRKLLTPSGYTGINLYDLSPNLKYGIQSFSSVNQIPVKNMIELKNHKTKIELVKNIEFKSIFSKLNLGKIEAFKITTDDGIEMDGFMMKPPNFDASKKYPVLFYVYGEPWGQTALNRWQRTWHFMMTQKGFIVITMDNRGTPCLKGRDWRKSIYRNVGIINSRDQAMATKEILKWNFIDKDKIAVWGWSGGGSMALNLLFRYPELYKLGISVAPVTDLLYYDNIYEERYMGLPQDNPEDYKNGSPVTYAKNLIGKLLLIHGTGDDNVHYQNTEALINELVKHNKQFDLMAYPNRSHGIYEGKGTREHLYTLMTDYLEENFGIK